MTNTYESKLALIISRLSEAAAIVDDAFNALNVSDKESKTVYYPHERVLLEALQANIGAALDAVRGAQDMATNFNYLGKDIENDINRRIDAA